MSTQPQTAVQPENAKQTATLVTELAKSDRDKLTAEQLSAMFAPIDSDRDEQLASDASAMLANGGRYGLASLVRSSQIATVRGNVVGAHGDDIASAVLKITGHKSLKSLDEHVNGTTMARDDETLVSIRETFTKPLLTVNAVKSTTVKITGTKLAVALLVVAVDAKRESGKRASGVTVGKYDKPSAYVPLVKRGDDDAQPKRKTIREQNADKLVKLAEQRAKMEAAAKRADERAAKRAADRAAKRAAREAAKLAKSAETTTTTTTTTESDAPATTTTEQPQNGTQNAESTESGTE